MLETYIPDEPDYSSAVDRHLVTRISERELWVTVLIILLLLAGLHRYSYRMEGQLK